MRIQKQPLERLVSAIFAAAGSEPAEARAVSEHLVEANLVGHDSHGVIRIAPYVNWVREGKLVPNREPCILTHELAAVEGAGRLPLAARCGLTRRRVVVSSW